MSQQVGAVILGGDFQGLGVIHSLAEKGIPIFLMDNEWSIGRYSRYVRRRFIRSDLFDPELFVSLLLEIGRREGLNGWVLFPNNDFTVKLMSINREELLSFYRSPVPSWEVVEKFYNKEIATRVAANIGIPVPKSYQSSSLDELLGRNLIFPLVLKPVNKEKYYPRTKKKAVRVNDRNSLVVEYRSMLEILAPEEIIVQEFIEGGTKNLYSFATFYISADQAVGLSAVRLRQHPMDFGKATTYAVSIKMPNLEKMALMFLKEINYYGLAEVEFMKDDKDGQFKFLEVNGRPWGWHTLIKEAGINLPWLLFLHMTGQLIPNVNGVEGVKWIRLITDIPTVVSELFKGRIRLQEYLESFRGKKTFAAFSYRDPVPFLMEFLMIPYLWRKRGF